jgi:acyl carrier protein
MTPRDDADVRRLVVAALEEANLARLRHDPRIVGFLSDGADVPMNELDMDSLDLMEFCIAIELSSGVSIVPNDLQRLRTLASVADAIRARRA